MVANGGFMCVCVDVMRSSWDQVFLLNSKITSVSFFKSYFWLERRPPSLVHVWLTAFSWTSELLVSVRRRRKHWQRICIMKPKNFRFKEPNSESSRWFIFALFLLHLLPFLSLSLCVIKSKVMFGCMFQSRSGVPRRLAKWGRKMNRWLDGQMDGWMNGEVDR